MINELDLLWVPNFIALEIYFLFGTKFSWNEEIGTCFNVECALLDRNSDFLGGYLVVTHSYLKVTSHYLVVTARYRSLLLVPSFTMDEKKYIPINIEKQPFGDVLQHGCFSKISQYSQENTCVQVSF